ncbi:MAG: hypothetical protein R2854_31050 [Caldilineaceae bacterium]
MTARTVWAASSLSAMTLPFLRDNPGVMTQVPVGGMPPVDCELAQSLQMMVDEATTYAWWRPSVTWTWTSRGGAFSRRTGVIAHMAATLTDSVIPASARIHDGAELDGPVVMGEA